MAEENKRDDTSSGPAMPAEPEVGDSTVLNFTVDAALLQELGERLVGKPFTALAELVKNSYDADAEHVVIRFGEDEIEVSDNGHGMDFTAFVTRWMRVGSPHKRSLQTSPEKGRPLTGSKGVGRLAAQFLSHSLLISSTSSDDPSKHLEVEVDWKDIQSAKYIQEVTAELTMAPGSGTYPQGSRHGTRILMRGLRQSWTPQELRELAKDLWFLQPPDNVGGDFEVSVEAADSSLIDEFDSQMRAILDVWEARLLGQVNEKGGKKQVQLFLQFKGFESDLVTYDVESSCPSTLSFDIRIYHLNYRQPEGITVGRARSYMNEFGGVHVYDAGFHLPHYGADTDWLDLEIDHSHRLSRSKLLPDELQVADGLNNLPTNSRLLGAVQVKTSAETAEGEVESLRITITRDRLVENSAYFALKDAVRWAIDYYAMRLARRRLIEAGKAAQKQTPKETFSQLRQTVDAVANQLSTSAYSALSKAADKAESAVKSQEDLQKAHTALLATLATAGMSSLAFEHEASKQLATLEALVDKLSGVSNGANEVAELTESIRKWISRARELQSLFGHLKSERDRKDKKAYRAKGLLDQVVPQIRPLLRGIEVDCTTVAPDLRLPVATFAEWVSIIQNVLVNSANAMLDSSERRVRISTHAGGRRSRLLIEDTGVGVDLSDSEDLFTPFERRLQLSVERRSMGLGGTGLGLTIVRMLTSNMGAQVRFVEPSPGFSTCLEVSWPNEDTSR